MKPPFADRSQAGRRLAERLMVYRQPTPLVLALPRGGVPVAFEVASALEAPMYAFPVRTLGVPGRPEVAMGAIASSGIRHLNDGLIRGLGLSAGDVERVTRSERHELEQEANVYDGRWPLPPLARRVAILVDDGAAAGAAMRAAVDTVRAAGAAWIVLAAPVVAAATAEELRTVADDVVTVLAPTAPGRVGRWYVDFSDVDDAAVRGTLARIRGRTLAPA